MNGLDLDPSNLPTLVKGSVKVNIIRPLIVEPMVEVWYIDLNSKYIEMIQSWSSTSLGLYLVPREPVGPHSRLDKRYKRPTALDFAKPESERWQMIVPDYCKSSFELALFREPQEDE